MNSKFPRLIATLTEAIEAMPDNTALRTHLNWVTMGQAGPVEYRGLRLVPAAFEPVQAELAAAR